MFRPLKNHVAFLVAGTLKDSKYISVALELEILTQSLATCVYVDEAMGIVTGLKSIVFDETQAMVTGWRNSAFYEEQGTGTSILRSMIDCDGYDLIPVIGFVYMNGRAKPIWSLVGGERGF